MTKTQHKLASKSHRENLLARVAGEPRAGYRGLGDDFTLIPSPLTNLQQIIHGSVALPLWFSEVPI